MDVKSAFLYGDITDEVYMLLPGEENIENVCKLNIVYFDSRCQIGIRSRGTELNQIEYLKEIIKKYSMQDCNSVNTPIEVNIDLYSLISETSNIKMQKICRKISGSLMYAALGTRPDLCKSVSLLSRFQDKANENFLKALKRILRYIKGTIEMVLLFEPNNSKVILQGFTDSDWAGILLTGNRRQDMYSKCLTPDRTFCCPENNSKRKYCILCFR